jgi:hypothetical protein
VEGIPAGATLVVDTERLELAPNALLAFPHNDSGYFFIGRCGEMRLTDPALRNCRLSKFASSPRSLPSGAFCGPVAQGARLAGVGGVKQLEKMFYALTNQLPDSAILSLSRSA